VLVLIEKVSTDRAKIFNIPASSEADASQVIKDVIRLSTQ